MFDFTRTIAQCHVWVSKKCGILWGVGGGNGGKQRAGNVDPQKAREDESANPQNAFQHLCYNVTSCYIGLALTWLFTEIFGPASSLASSLEDNNIESNQEFKY